MRRLALALCLLGPAAAAQPTASDSALVDRLLVALRFDLAEQVMDNVGAEVTAQTAAESPAAAQLVAPMMGALSDVGALVDSVRAAFLADLRPGLVREALAFLEGPVQARVMEQSLFQPGQFDLVQMMALLEDPGDRPLADSALAARYAAAAMAASQPPGLQRRMTQALWDAFPAEFRAAIQESVGKEAFFELTEAAPENPQQQAMMTQTARLGLGGIDEADIRALTAYYESEAGRYVQGVAAEGAARAYLPRVVEGMQPAFKALMAQAAAGSDLSEGTLPPPPLSPGPDSDGVYEVADVQPELIGGLEGLLQAVEYPEAARRAGVEGRVVIQFVVDEAGRVVDPLVLRSSDPVLSEAALAAVRQARFRPGTTDGRPVRVRFAVPVTFRLTDPEPTDEPPLVAPPAEDQSEVRVIQETAPRLIGGLAGLARRTVYPEDARQSGVEGRVVVQFVVTEAGRVEDAAVLSSPDPRLSRAALAAVRQSRFEPGRQEGQPVRVRFSLPVDFTLR